MASMSPGERDAFLCETRIAALATSNENGSPTIVPAWYGRDGGTAGFAFEDSARMRRIGCDPCVALPVEEGIGVPGAWMP